MTPSFRPTNEKPKMAAFNFHVESAFYNEIKEAAHAHGMSIRVFSVQALRFALDHMEPPSAEKHQGKARGGHARAAKLTPTQRSEIARQAATKRWRNAPWAEQDGIPVIMQLPNKPQTARQVGHAPANVAVAEIARRFGVDEGNLVEGKMMRRKGHWRLCVLALPEF